jgi:hypothetical protein
MATHDHTARARPSGQKRPAFPLHDDELLFPLSEINIARQTYATKLAGSAIAVQTIYRLLNHSKALYRTEAEGGCSSCGIGPFTVSQTNGLHYLRQYAESLTPESSG